VKKVTGTVPSGTTTSERSPDRAGLDIRASGNVPKWLAMATTVGLGAAARVGWSFLRVKKRAQGADPVFRGQLTAAGMGPKQADELSKAYLSNVRLRKLIGSAIRGWRPSGRDGARAV